MPAQIVVVHDDPELRCALADAIGQGGRQVLALSDPMMALDVLSRPEKIRVLVTRVNFGEGKLHGVALARMVRSRNCLVKVLFVGRPENATFTTGEGVFIAHPVSFDQAVAVVDEFLREPPNEPERYSRPTDRRARRPAFSGHFVADPRAAHLRWPQAQLGSGGTVFRR